LSKLGFKIRILVTELRFIFKLALGFSIRVQYKSGYIQRQRQYYFRPGQRIEPQEAGYVILI
jgi:hypothetical protein